MENTTNNPANTPSPYLSDIPWVAERPRSLVVCCSDGRLQDSTDEFLDRLGVNDYDRLYAPGGPAALADSGSEYLRANTFRADLQMLVRAHAIEQVILIFHGAADDGPDGAGCAHYGRIMPGRSHAEMAQRQIGDMAEVVRHLAAGFPQLDIRVYRAEVQADRRVKFLTLAESRRV